MATRVFLQWGRVQRDYDVDEEQRDKVPQKNRIPKFRLLLFAVTSAYPESLAKARSVGGTVLDQYKSLGEAPAVKGLQSGIERVSQDHWDVEGLSHIWPPRRHRDAVEALRRREPAVTAVARR